MGRIKSWFSRETSSEDARRKKSTELGQNSTTSPKSDCGCLGNNTVSLIGGDIGLQLHDKIIRNDVVGCERLLASGFDPNKPLYIYHKKVPEGSSGLTSLRVETRFLHMAITYRRPAVLSALLKAGADPNITDSTNRYPLQLVITYWPRVRYAASLTSTEAHLTDDDRKFQLYLDDHHHRSQCTLEMLLKSGAEADVTCGENAESLLHLAAQYGITDCLGPLLHYGARTDHVSKQGETALTLALKKGNLKIAMDLMCCGAAVNHIDAEGRTALHYACLISDGDTVVRYLILHGAKSDIQDTDGNTPLHLSAKGGHIATTLALLEMDATADVLNNFGETPMFLLLDIPFRIWAIRERLLAAHRLREASLCLTLMNYRGQLPRSLSQDEELCRQFSQHTRGDDNEPASLFWMALHRVRRCLGYKNTCNIQKLQLDCAPGLKGLITWQWQRRDTTQWAQYRCAQ